MIALFKWVGSLIKNLNPFGGRAKKITHEDSPIEEVLEFWFSAKDSSEYGQLKSFWFHASPSMDLAIGEKFSKLYHKAKNDQLNHLKETSEGLLTLIILLDQIPRHVFRGKKESFETDAQAIRLAKEGVLKGFDQSLPDFMKLFFYLPLEHSEDLEDQEISLRLFEALGDPMYLKYAQEHFDIIKKFGRFPHRNNVLNRWSRHEEIVFLDNKNRNNG